MIELVCIDVDGTLVGSAGTVDPGAWAAAGRARAAGLRLCLCSGRPAFGVSLSYAQRLDPRGWHVFQNGASVLHLETGASCSARIATEVLAELVARARASGRVLELYADREYAVEIPTERARRHAELLEVPFAPRPFESLGAPVVRAQWVLAVDEAPAVLAEPHPGLELSPSTSPVMPGTVFVNMTPRGVDKGTGVAAVAEAYGVPLERVMMVGDGGNDVPALSRVGVPVAMGNAEPAAQAAARIHVGDVDRGGLMEALELAIAAAEKGPAGARTRGR